MTNDSIVKWQNSYSIGIRLVDEQHKELIRLTNRLFVSCMSGLDKSRDTFLEIIHEAVDYVAYHFGTEEKMMIRVDYPDYHKHKKEHESFVREVFTKVEDFKNGKILAPLLFVYFLRDWVLDHIALSDKKMGGYFLQLQRSGQLQKITFQVKRDESINCVQTL